MQGLAGEARRLSTTIAAQEREAAAREGALTAAAEETATAQSELAENQLHLQQAVADVQVLQVLQVQNTKEKLTCPCHFPACASMCPERVTQPPQKPMHTSIARQHES